VKGASAQAMAAELRERDQRDRTRAASPLAAAEDAIVLDSTAMSEEEVLNRIAELVERRLAAKS
jgi:CMP/dCMP kinase